MKYLLVMGSVLMIGGDQHLATPHPGWPITVTQQSNDGRKSVAWLPELVVAGVKDPVVQVFDQENGKLVYA